MGTSSQSHSGWADWAAPGTPTSHGRGSADGGPRVKTGSLPGVAGRAFPRRRPRRLVLWVRPLARCSPELERLGQGPPGGAQPQILARWPFLDGACPFLTKEQPHSSWECGLVTGGCLPRGRAQTPPPEQHRWWMPGKALPPPT